MDSIFNALSRPDPLSSDSENSPAKLWAMRTEEKFVSGGKRFFRELLRDKRYHDTVISRRTETIVLGILKSWEEETDGLDPNNEDDLEELSQLAEQMRRCLFLVKGQIDKDRRSELQPRV